MPMTESKGERMARLQRERQEAQPGFDVTVETIIGRVEFGADGERSEVQAAFEIIAKIVDSDGPEEATYRFPARAGGTVTVQVGHEEK